MSKPPKFLNAHKRRVRHDPRGLGTDSHKALSRERALKESEMRADARDCVKGLISHDEFVLKHTDSNGGFWRTMTLISVLFLEDVKHFGSL